LEELDFEYAKMRLFAQSLVGEVRKRFRALPIASIRNFEAFETNFLEKWGDKKNPLQFLTQYNNMRRSPNEIMQDFSAIFVTLYNLIPMEVKLPLRLLNSDMLILLKVIFLCY